MMELRSAATKDLTLVSHFAQGAQRVIVAGSTWPKDETLLAQFMQTDPSSKLILVPHEIDPKHMHFIFRLFQGRMVRYSAVSAMTDEVSRRNILQQATILLVDTMGLLSSIYRFGHVAYIGGGFGVGIHNTIEAAAYGMPVVFGPNYSHFREAQGLIDANAARSIKNYSELEAALTTALEQHELLGAKAAEYVQSELGATEKIYNDIFNRQS
jgi:3-deoxy-D-manno-octulosonic-acid transferase